MKRLFTFLASIIAGICFFTGNAFAQEDVQTKAYASLQNCMADARDIVDNGSYAAYCMDAYNLEIKDEKEHQQLNSTATDTE